ncbi:M28 family metallopeptidase [Pelagerythrobacter sp.]|uniref:M28 family metallopeptidase n=1 Tax=Pelagerythrobacter sp. TaxID=2800702 RepID=UPI0035AE4499
MGFWNHIGSLGKIVGLLAGAFASLGTVAAAQSQTAQSKDSTLIKADAETIEADVRFLADDLLEGREAGTRADRLAQHYLVARYRMIGLQPAGDDGTYLQKFGMRMTQLEPGSASIRFSGQRKDRFENGDDVALFGHPVEADQQVDAEMVFAGYGIVSDRQGLNDYEGLDVDGRIVVLLGGPPAFLPATDAAHLASAREQQSQAARRGATGVMYLWTPALEQRYPFALMNDQIGRRDMVWLDEEGRPATVNPLIRVTGFLHGAAVEAALAGTSSHFGDLVEQAQVRSPDGFPLKARISVSRRSTHDDTLTSANVAGFLEGSDPELREEIIVLTAHFDHVGIGRAYDGDAIYNGALDNAVGTAMLLDVATLLASSESRPRRSILFLAVGAEEKGILGSDYFAAHMAEAGGKIVANVNLDGAFPFYDFRDVIAFGAEQSDIIDHLTAATAELSLTVAPDPFPEESIFTRSDQYSFMPRGIPGVFLYNGFTDMAGDNVGRAVWDDLMARVVHLPTDDLMQPIDWDVLAKFSDVFRRLALRLGNADTRPQWRQESMFANDPRAPLSEGSTGESAAD